jgi:hypothetical protein
MVAGLADGGQREKLSLQDRTQTDIFGLQQGIVPLDDALRDE